jgi:transcriptional regulator GlxA family with amidase domain
MRFQRFPVLTSLILIVTACAAPPPPTESAGDPTANSVTAWQRAPLYKDVDLRRKLQVGFLIVDGVYNSELVAPYDIFHHTVFHTEPLPGMEVFTVAPTRQPITSFEGLRITPHYSFADHPPIDVLVVPSAEGSMEADLQNEAMMDWVRKVGREASFVVSLCDGAFVLAAAGLLEGRAATTFPGDQDRFAAMFPEIDLWRGPSFVHDGPAITSQGGARSYDPALHLVDHLYGEKVAKGVGRGLVIPWPPEGLSAVVVPR